MSRVLTNIAGVEVTQEADKRIHYVADLDDDVDGAEHSYRLDNRSDLGALDDVHASAGWPHGDWWNVLVRDPNNRDKPFVDDNGFCVSMTSYQRPEFNRYDRQRYVDAVNVPYMVAPGIVRKLCQGVLLGCLARVTDTLTGRSIEGVCADFSGYSIGEASDKVCKFFDPHLSAHNGDGRKIYLFEFYPDMAAPGFKLIPA
jgi:hypothetical protein